MYFYSMIIRLVYLQYIEKKMHYFFTPKHCYLLQILIIDYLSYLQCILNIILVINFIICIYTYLYVSFHLVYYSMIMCHIITVITAKLSFLSIHIYEINYMSSQYHINSFSLELPNYLWNQLNESKMMHDLLPCIADVLLKWMKYSFLKPSQSSG